MTLLAIDITDTLIGCLSLIKMIEESKIKPLVWKPRFPKFQKDPEKIEKETVWYAKFLQGHYWIYGQWDAEIVMGYYKFLGYRCWHKRQDKQTYVGYYYETQELAMEACNNHRVELINEFIIQVINIELT